MSKIIEVGKAPSIDPTNYDIEAIAKCIGLSDTEVRWVVPALCDEVRRKVHNQIDFYISGTLRNRLGRRYTKLLCRVTARVLQFTESCHVEWVDYGVDPETGRGDIAVCLGEPLPERIHGTGVGVYTVEGREGEADSRCIREMVWRAND